MDNLPVLEEYYNKYVKNLGYWLPEGIIEVDIELLKNFGLLTFYNNKVGNDEMLTRYFQVIESEDKITLVNDHFVIWIVPENVNDVPTTYALIAINVKDQPNLELAFSTSGVYNTSRLVLRVLEKFLVEIQENEELLKNFKQVS